MFSEDFEQEVVDGLDARMIGERERPAVEMSSEDDDYSDWVAALKDEIRKVVGTTREFQELPFCRMGLC